MKKYLAILSLLSVVFVSCGKEEKPAEPVAEATQTEAAATTEGTQTEATAEEAKTEEATNEENQYAGFESAVLETVKDKGILSVKVSPYAKGIDIIFTADNKNITEDDFKAMAETAAKELKAQFDFIEKDAVIGAGLDYQPNPNENAETLFTTEVK